MRRLRPSHPVPYVRDDRETPLCVGRDGEGYAGDLRQKGTEIFLKEGLDRQITKQPVGQNHRIENCLSDAFGIKPSGGLSSLARQSSRCRRHRSA